MKFDARRLWECPKCGRRSKQPGDVVSQFCRCGGESVSEGAWMRLVEPKRTVRADRPRTVAEISCEELDPEAPQELVEGNGQTVAEAAQDEAVSDGLDASAAELPHEG